MSMSTCMRKEVERMDEYDDMNIRFSGAWDCRCRLGRPRTHERLA